MKLSGEDYIAGAGERLRAAYEAYKTNYFVESLYFSGVAAECVLRAFAQDAEVFDGRHDLAQLLKASVLLEYFSSNESRSRISAALGEVWKRWKNNYRYASSDRLRVQIKKLALDRGVKGDALKETARSAYENASTIVEKGTYQWTLKWR